MLMKENGISKEEVLKEEDIVENKKYTGYHKKILIKDYVFIIGDNTKKSNVVKEITVEISYKLANKDKKVKISTYITNKN